MDEIQGSCIMPHWSHLDSFICGISTDAAIALALGQCNLARNGVTLDGIMKSQSVVVVVVVVVVN